MNKLLKISKALSDPTRYKIIEILLRDETCACDLVLPIQKAQPTISLQLKKLEKLGIIESRKNGKQIIYSIKEKKIAEIFKLFK